MLIVRLQKFNSVLLKVEELIWMFSVAQCWMIVALTRKMKGFGADGTPTSLGDSESKWNLYIIMNKEQIVKLILHLWFEMNGIELNFGKTLYINTNIFSYFKIWTSSNRFCIELCHIVLYFIYFNSCYQAQRGGTLFLTLITRFTRPSLPRDLCIVEISTLRQSTNVIIMQKICQHKINCIL